MRIVTWVGGAFVVLLLVLIVGFVALQRGDIPYATLESRYATPASHYIDLPDGVRMHYRDEGRADGPVLVFVHGYSASAADWDGWVKALGDTYRIIAPDLPGHGLTRAPKDYQTSTAAQVKAVDDLMERLNLTGFVIGGNSMGGGVAWRYAAAYPAKVRALVLVDAAGWPPEKGRRNDALVFKLLANPMTRTLIKNMDNTGLTKQGLDSAFIDTSLVTPAVVKRYTDLSRAPGHRDILIARQSSEGAATPERLAAITAPTLILFGQDDHLIPAADGQKFKDAIKGSTLIVYPGVGHVPMEQIPDKSAADVRAWFAGLSAPPPVDSHRITVAPLPPARRG